MTNNTPWVNNMIEHYPDYMDHVAECIVWEGTPMNFEDFVIWKNKRNQKIWDDITDDLTALN